MTNLPFALKFPAVLRTISWKTLLVCIAGVLRRARLPMPNCRWPCRKQQPLNSPGFAKETFLGWPSGFSSWPFRCYFSLLVSRPPAPSMRIDFRPPLVLDSHALCLRLSGPGRTYGAAFRLLCRLCPGSAGIQESTDVQRPLITWGASG